MSLHTIENGKTQAIVSSLGGTVTSFKVAGKDIFYPWREIGARARGGCPICAPWFSKSARGPQHGHLRDMEAVRYESIGHSAISLFFRRRGDAGYPWQIDYVTTVSIGYNGVMSLKLRIERGKDGISDPAPILPGFHPYFACADASKVTIEIAGETYSGFSPDARMILAKDTKVNILIPERKIEMLLLDNFEESSHVVFWTDAPEKYFCVEPILEDKRMFDTPAGQHLEQGQSLELVVAFRVS